MIKGVNRNVIEVVDTGSDMFERAILFVRPSGRDSDPERLESSARSFLSHARMRRKVLRRRAALGTVLKYILSAALGAGIAAGLLAYF